MGKVKCFFRYIFRVMRTFFKNLRRPVNMKTVTSRHVWVLESENSKEVVLKCEDCGKLDISRKAGRGA